jgi:hypothetical protein
VEGPYIYPWAPRAPTCAFVWYLWATPTGIVWRKEVGAPIGAKFSVQHARPRIATLLA